MADAHMHTTVPLRILSVQTFLREHDRFWILIVWLECCILSTLLPHPCICLQTFRREHDRFWILTAHPEVNLLAAGHDRWAGDVQWEHLLQ